MAASDLCPPDGLFVSGLCHRGSETVALVSPDEPGFRAIFAASPEFADGRSDPMDNGSARMIGNWARRIGGRAVFQSDGPPYPAFFERVLASGHFGGPPVGMSAHHCMGKFASFRGALVMPGHLILRPKEPAPARLDTRRAFTPALRRPSHPL